MRFLIDAQLSPHVAGWLRGEGHPAEHLVELGLETMSDFDIYRTATNMKAILVTKDADFVHFAKAAKGAQVLWIRTGNSSTAELLHMLGKKMEELETSFRDGEPVVQFRR